MSEHNDADFAAASDAGLFYPEIRALDEFEREHLQPGFDLDAAKRAAAEWTDRDDLPADDPRDASDAREILRAFATGDPGQAQSSKYDSRIDEIAWWRYEIAAFGSVGCGDVASPVGWFDQDVALGAPAIFRENDQGFRSIERFTSTDAAEARCEELESAYGEWLGGPEG